MTCVRLPAAATPWGVSEGFEIPPTLSPGGSIPPMYPAKGGVAILKVLQTNLCRNHCTYCRLASCEDAVKRVSFSPDELARIFMEFYRKKLVHGIFLSSGVGLDPDAAMARMIGTAEILRGKYAFNYYIHLKILPGASQGYRPG